MWYPCCLHTGLNQKAREAVLAGLPPIKAETAESSAQCTLLDMSHVTTLTAERDATQLALAAARTEVSEAQSALADTTARLQRTQEELTELQTAHQELLHEQQRWGSRQLATTAATGLHSTRAAVYGGTSSGQEGYDSGVSGQTPRGDEGGMVPYSPALRDPASAGIAERALAALGAVTPLAPATGALAGLPPQLVTPLAQLARWVPTSGSGGGATSGAGAATTALIEEHLRAAGSVHALLTQFESEFSAAIETVERLSVDNRALSAANDELRRQLESTTERLELALSAGMMRGVVARPSPHITSPSPSHYTVPDTHMDTAAHTHGHSQSQYAPHMGSQGDGASHSPDVLQQSAQGKAADNTAAYGTQGVPIPDPTYGAQPNGDGSYRQSGYGAGSVDRKGYGSGGGVGYTGTGTGGVYTGSGGGGMSEDALRGAVGSPIASGYLQHTSHAPSSAMSESVSGSVVGMGRLDSSLISPAARGMGAPEGSQRRGWLGFLFPRQARPKKRVRNDLL